MELKTCVNGHVMRHKNKKNDEVICSATVLLFLTERGEGSNFDLPWGERLSFMTLDYGHRSPPLAQ